MEYKFFIVDAFTNKAYQGNPAGIVIDQGELQEEDCLKIARELKMSETAFIERLDKDDYRIRYFTPVEEVDLCGHATIASFYLLASYQYIEGLEEGTKQVLARTKAGNLPIFLDYKREKIDKVTMVQARPEEGGFVRDLEKIGPLFGISPEDLGFEGLEAEKISTGIMDLMLPLKNRQALEKLQADREKIIAFSKEEEVYSIHAFTLDGDWVYQRNFSPILGIDEEAATGTSTGALFHYLAKHRGLEDLQAKQGLEMGRESKLYASYREVKGEKRITVGGQAAIVGEGVLHV